jgi:hypothetical protein
VEHSCGHDKDHDLSQRRPSERAGYARWLAGRECSDCWTAKRDRQNAEDRDRWLAERRAEESAAADAWEKAADMPALDGRSDKAVEWGRRVRHQLMVANPVGAAGTVSSNAMIAVDLCFKRGYSLPGIGQDRRFTASVSCSIKSSTR